MAWILGTIFIAWLATKADDFMNELRSENEEVDLVHDENDRDGNLITWGEELKSHDTENNS